MKKRSAIISAILSIITPGLGDVYNGKLKTGIIITASFLIFYFVAIGTGAFTTFDGMLITLIIFILSYLIVIVHSVIIAKRNNEYVLKNFNKPVVYILWIILFHGLSYLNNLTNTVEANRLATNSMTPTLQEDDFIMSLIGLEGVSTETRGELISFQSPFDTGVVFVKRLIALPNETIEIRSDSIFINGDHYKDDFSGAPVTQDLPANKNLSPTKIPEGKVFVLGDNRNNSQDSRHFGSIGLDKLVGRPLYIYWSNDKSRIGTTL